MTKLNVDLTNVAATLSATDFIPAGTYNVRTSSCEFKANSKKTGHYLETVFTVSDGVHQNSNLIERFNIDNKNADTQKYALADVKKMLLADGTKNPNQLPDTDYLVGLEFAIVVDEYDDEFTNEQGVTIQSKKNNVKKFKKKGEPNMQEAIGATDAENSAPADNAKRPWD